MDPLVSSLGIPTGLAGWNMLQSKTPADFPALTNDPVVKQQIAYFEQHAPKAATAKTLLSDPKLQDFVLTAYGLTSESGMNALMVKVLNSNPNSTNSFARQMVNSTFTQIARDFNYGGTSIPARPAVASSAEVSVNGLFQQSNFASFSGKFGGVTLSQADVSAATTYQGLASALQTAFRRADGNRTDISVTLDGLNLKLTDAKGRGTAAAFAWTANPANTGAAPVAASPIDLVAGSKAMAAIGGPAITNPTFIKQVVQKYSEAQFQQVVGNTSNSLREALYAKQQLPTISNWYQVISSRPLADVIQTVLNLPSSFGMLNVDKQAQMLGQRMKITDFQNPAKLSKLLTQFVAMSADTQTQSSSGFVPALQLMGDSSSSGSSFGTSSSTTGDSFSSAATAAMLFSTSSG